MKSTQFDAGHVDGRSEMARLFRITEWRGRPKIEFIESDEFGFDDASKLFGFMGAKAAKLLNAILANGAGPVLRLLVETASTRLSAADRNDLQTLIAERSTAENVTYCHVTNWNGHSMIEFSTTVCPTEEDERRRFRFGASKATKIVRAIRVDGLESVIRALAQVAGDRADQNSVNELIVTLPAPEVSEKSPGEGDPTPEQLLKQINKFLANSNSNAEVVALLRQAVKIIQGLLECKGGELSQSEKNKADVSIGKLVNEVSALL